MRALRKRLAIVCVWALASASCTAAALPVVAPEQAVEAVRDCASATSPEGVETEVLEDLGWKPAALTSEGEDIETSLRTYGKGQGDPLILTSEAGDASSKGCLVSGGLDGDRSFEEMKAAFDAALQRTDTKDGDHHFRVGEDFAILSQTGSRRAPAFRVIVMEFGDDS